jgi:hypothetical protein
MSTCVIFGKQNLAVDFYVEPTLSRGHHFDSLDRVGTIHGNFELLDDRLRQPGGPRRIASFHAKDDLNVHGSESVPALNGLQPKHEIPGRFRFGLPSKEPSKFIENDESRTAEIWRMEDLARPNGAVFATGQIN